MTGSTRILLRSIAWAAPVAVLAVTVASLSGGFGFFTAQAPSTGFCCLQGMDDCQPDVTYVACSTDPLFEAYDVSQEICDAQCGTAGPVGFSSASASSTASNGAQHLECSANACVLVPGAGPNVCSTNPDNCGQSHLACVGQTCAGVPGPGMSTCAVNADCAASSASGGSSVSGASSSGAGSSQGSSGAGSSASGQSSSATSGGSSASFSSGASSSAGSASSAGSSLAASSLSSLRGSSSSARSSSVSSASSSARSSSSSFRGSSSSAAPVCGNNAREGTEQCDDGNTQSNDGCSSLCIIERGWQCVPACTAICGDAIRAGIEQCDDGNRIAGDGCSSLCVIEPGVQCGPAGASSSSNACTVNECGAAPSGSSNMLCPDGSIGGTVCQRDVSGTCGWINRLCSNNGCPTGSFCLAMGGVNNTPGLACPIAGLQACPNGGSQMPTNNPPRQCAFADGCSGACYTPCP